MATLQELEDEVARLRALHEIHKDLNSEDLNKKAIIFAKLICVANGIEPVSSIDGSADWFMFYHEAIKLVTMGEEMIKLRERIKELEK